MHWDKKLISELTSSISPKSGHGFMSYGPLKLMYSVYLPLQSNTLFFNIILLISGKILLYVSIFM